MILLGYSCQKPDGKSWRRKSLGLWLKPAEHIMVICDIDKIKYNKILTYILRSIFLEIPHLELLRWRKTLRDTNGKGECHI
jgi:hypothetical protein